MLNCFKVLYRMHRRLGIVSRVGEQGPEVGRGSPHVWGRTFLFILFFAYRAAVAQFSGPDVLGQGGCCDSLFKGEVRRCLTLGLEDSNPRSRGTINHLARLAQLCPHGPAGRRAGQLARLPSPPSCPRELRLFFQGARFLASWFWINARTRTSCQDQCLRFLD